jgi:hypothetical protein
MFLIGKAEGREHRNMGTLVSVPMGLLSGLPVQSEISELLDELYYDSSP